MEKPTRIEPQQLIDEHRNFNAQAIKNVIDHLPEVEKQYLSIAIIGVQNSGKSTLLNKLFGTNFDVLHQIAGTRTTRGILASLDKENNFLVMDVEGNDAKDRANEQQYEKMISTFALVEADTLIINVWSKTLGQYTGSQYETLTAVLQICISQFKQQSPKTLLFCVRDFNDQEDDQRQIRTKLVRDVNNIWLKLQKPTQYEKYNNTPQKFFSIEVAVLRKYKEANPKTFNQDIAKLRERFVNPKDEGYVFKNKKTSFNMPLKDLPKLMENSWQSITTNKKLNLPNQKQQLSNFRCSQILNEQLIAFKQQVKHIEQKLQPVDLGQIFQKYSQKFQLQTYNYGRHIVDQKQKALKQQMTDTLKKVAYQILDKQQKKLKDQFRVNSGYVNQENSQNLQDKLKELKIQTLDKYAAVYKTFNYEIQQRKQKIEKLAIFLDKENKENLKKIKEIINAEFEKECSRQIRLMSSEMLKNHFGKDFWSNVEKDYVAKRNSLIKQHEIKVLWAENRRIQAVQIDQVDEKLSTQLKKTIREEFQKSLMNRVFDIFLNLFTKNKQGVSYNFNILEQSKIAQLYDYGRDSARELVSLINLYNVKRSKKSTILQFDEEQSDNFFESTWLSSALTQLDKKMIAEHETIIRRKVCIYQIKKQNEMKRVPIWLFVVIFYFVYDDVWFSSEDYPITNLVLTIFLIFVAFFFAIGQGNAFMELWNLGLEYGNQAVQQVRKRIGK